jgi:hypothetical protein
LAVELEPTQKAFRAALKKMQQRLNVDLSTSKQIKAPDGQDVTVVNNQRGNSDTASIGDSPAVKALYSVMESVGTTNSYIACDRYTLQLQSTLTPIQYPTTRQYLFEGLQQWVGGMKGAIAQLSIGTSIEAEQQWTTLQHHILPQDRDQIIETATEMFGGIPTECLDMAHLVSGYAHLGGLYLTLEFGESSQLCPPGAIMANSPFSLMCQPMAIMRSIDTWVETLISPEYGFDGVHTLKLNKAVFCASSAFYVNAGQQSYPHSSIEESMSADPDPSPQDIVDYIKNQLTKGRKTWDEMRVYVSTIYRGTVLWSFAVRMLTEQIAEAHEQEKWAISFMELADKEFSVNGEQSFAEKGSAFRNSLRIGVMMGHMQSHEVLRDHKMNGPYPMAYTLDLAVKISEMAHKRPSKRRLNNKKRQREGSTNNNAYADYMSALDDVAFRRKPLVLAHSVIGSCLNSINMHLSLAEYRQIATHHGLMERTDDDDDDCCCDPFALIAKHYKIAAENALPDDNDTAIYWWATACNMALASSKSGFTLGDMLEAISHGEAAEAARDRDLFGENKQKDGSFEIVAKLVARRYAHVLQEDRSSFILPQVKLVRSSSKPESSAYKSHLEVDGDVFCPNFHEYELKEIKLLDSEEKKQFRDLVDTSEAEQKYGAVAREGVPSLETLCIRALHTSGCTFAKGETDGAVIQYKAMVAAAAAAE